MTIQYDEGKNKTNIRKHGISFITPSIAFDDQNAVVIYDDFHSGSEERYNLIGAVGDHILFIVYAMRGEAIRLISARPATRREKETYYLKK